ncbi:MAG: hypothetical protein ABI671_16070 [Burkholderiales bacterium]
MDDAHSAQRNGASGRIDHKKMVLIDQRGEEEEEEEKDISLSLLSLALRPAVPVVPVLFPFCSRSFSTSTGTPKPSNGAAPQAESMVCSRCSRRVVSPSGSVFKQRR